MQATSAYLNRPLRSIDEVLFERAVRSGIWEQAMRDRAVAKWQADAAK